MALPEDQVRIDIQINASAAIQSLKEMLSSVDGVDAKVSVFSKHLLDLSRQWNVPWQSLLNTIRQVNAELVSKGRGGTLFGNIGGKSQDDLLKMSQGFIEGAQAGNRYLTTVEGVDTATKNFDGSTKTANTSLSTTKRNLDDASKSGQGFNSVLRLIRGTLVAIGVFRVFEFITESINKAIETAQEYETSLYRLANVESILSKAGTDISLEGLKKSIQEVKKELPIFSEADITQQISLIGIMTKEWGLTEQQITDTAKAIGVLNIRSADTEDLLTTTNKVLTALVAPSGRGIASLGLDFSEAALKAEALKTGVLKAGDAFSKLTDHDKDMLKLAILLENTGQELQTVQKFLETNTGALAEQNAEWEDTLRVAGQAFIGLKATAAPFIISFLKFLQDGINGVKAFIVILQAAKDAFNVFAAAIVSFLSNPLDFIQNFGEVQNAIADAFTSGLADGFNKFFSGQIPENAPQWFEKLFGNFVDNADTATASMKNLGNSIEDVTQLTGFDKLQQDLENLGQKADDAEAKFQRLWAGVQNSGSFNFQTNFSTSDKAFQEFGTKVQDHLIDMRNMWQDYERDRSNLIEDYNRKVRETIADFNRRRRDAEQKYRQNELNAEAKFQEQLRQLREKFLFNLEDALRERDARQVLRLQEQYRMDKEALINENALRQKSDQDRHAQEMADLKQQEADRLRQMAEEQAVKLQRQEEEYNLKRQRAEEEFQIEQQRAAEEHQLEMDRIAQEINDRLMAFAQAIGDEYGLNEDGVNALYALLKQYYGPQGYFDGLYSYSAKSMVANAQAMLSALNSIVSRAQSVLSSLKYTGTYVAATPKPIIQGTAGIVTGGTIGSRIPTHIGGRATGGSFLALRPTKATFGEAGPELATFTPLGGVTRLPDNVGQGIGAGLGGKLQLMIDLSPDLQVRIVDNALQEVETAINSVQRARY